MVGAPLIIALTNITDEVANLAAAEKRAGRTPFRYRDLLTGLWEVTHQPGDNLKAWTFLVRVKALLRALAETYPHVEATAALNADQRILSLASQMTRAGLRVDAPIQYREGGLIGAWIVRFEKPLSPAAALEVASGLCDRGYRGKFRTKATLLIPKP